jgi:hypothetical protein
MKSIRWTYVVAAAAAICLGPRAASAQYGYYRSGPGMTDIGSGGPTYPAYPGTASPAYAVAPTSPAIGGAPAIGVAPAMGAQPSYSGGCGCDAGCGNCGSGCGLGGGGGGDPGWRAWGDYLYLRPRNEGVEYAVPLDVTNSVQVGPTSVMDPQFSSGFRVGIERALDECSEIAVSYTYYRDENVGGSDPVSTNLEALVFQPQFFGWTSALAHEITKFQYVDFDYRHNLWGGDCTCINYFAGVRYAELSQEFDATFSDPVLGVANAVTNVNFDGVGLRLGLDGERAFRGGFYGTAKADVNFIGGEFRGSYFSNNPNIITGVATNWNEACFTTILEAEVAVGWQSAGGRVRVSIGYLLTDWCNAVKTADYINSVQQNSYHGANQLGTSSLVFDGLTGHVELAW